jgi:hypothetical protein
LAHGYKAPNGIGFGVDGEIFTTDNEGHMVPTNKLMHVPQHGNPFFGNDEVLHQFHLPVPPMKQPVLWMPTSELSNSPSQPVAFNMGPFMESQMVFGDIHYGGLHRVFVEKVNGEYQGAIFRFTQGLEAGITGSPGGVMEIFIWLALVLEVTSDITDNAADCRDFHTTARPPLIWSV